MNSKTKQDVALVDRIGQSIKANSDSLWAIAILLVPNLIAWVLLYPGFMQPDHLLRIAEVSAGTPYALQSLFWTYLAYPFIYLSSNYAVYGLVQIAIFVYCAYRSISIMHELGFIKGMKLAAALFGFFPTFLLYNELYSSDVVFAYCVMLLTALCIKYVFVINGNLPTKSGGGYSMQKYASF